MTSRRISQEGDGRIVQRRDRAGLAEAKAARRSGDETHTGEPYLGLALWGREGSRLTRNLAHSNRTKTLEKLTAMLSQAALIAPRLRVILAPN
jgi:hypothetical protein